MADPTLHGNGIACPACELRREEAHRHFTGRIDVPCNNCGGTGRVAFSTSDIIRGHVVWARENYWPERIARWAASAASKSG